MKVKLILLSLFACCLGTHSISQCSVTSSQGYTVTISLNPITINKPATCPWGYNYSVNVQYSIVFSGTNIPASLNTLQGNVNCGGTNLFFNLPNTGGSGIVTSSNNWTSMTNCAVATPSNLNCNTVLLQIQGPGIGNQYINCPIIVGLPVELTSFTGEYMTNRVVKLNWETSSEKNNELFEIERSENGSIWEKIGKVPGAGNSETLIKYEYLDKNPLDVKLIYYRLKQIDFDGKMKYSTIIAVQKDLNAFHEIAIYPNPTEELLFIEGEPEQLEFISVFSIEGRNMKESFQLIPSTNGYIMDLKLFKPGAYLIYYTGGVKRFIKS